MTSTAIHHIEICVADLQDATGRLVTQYGFRLIGKRSTEFCDQHVLSAGDGYFIVSQRKIDLHQLRSNKYEDEEWTVFCCQDRPEHSIDSAFNVALLVKDVSRVTERARDVGARILKPPRFVEHDEKSGKVEYSIIKSCCGDVMHTLISKENYSGWFLPGFEYLGSRLNASTTNIWDKYANRSYIDHVTYVCRSGESSEIMDWYGKVFSMKRFLVNRHEDIDNGLILGTPVWMRIRAMEYWLCSEVALQTAASNGVVTSNNVSNGQEIHRPRFILVLAESAYKDKSSLHLEEYVRDHCGPGVQHIALSTSNIFGTLAELTSRDVKFRRPPELYYQELERLSDIKECGYKVECLKAYGILIDTEADVEDFKRTSENIDLKRRHLMQIFTMGVFHPNTFFLEIIQRCGARGFGAGNILTLARCFEQQGKSD